MPKKYRNPQGEMLYTFVWEGGGGNMVYAFPIVTEGFTLLE